MTNLKDRYIDDSNDKFTKVLFRPGYSPQNRELISLQSILKGQIAAIGDHLFKEGSMVVGGSIKSQNAKTLIIDSTYSGAEVDLTQFLGKTIIEVDGNGVETGARGLVFATSSESSVDPACLHYEDEKSTISIGSGVSVRVEGTSVYASIRAFEQPVRDCSFARLLGGIFYFNKTFVRVEDQLIVYSKFNKIFSGFVGLKFEEQIVTEFDDPSLYDPARGYPNFNGAGAHREKYEASLISYSYNDERPQDFVALLEISEGSIKSETLAPEYNELEDTLARRTEDESGSYVVNFFRGDLLEKVNVPVLTIEPSTTSSLVINVNTAIPHNYRVGDAVRLPDDSEYAGDWKVKEIISETMFTIETGRTNSVTETDLTVYRTDHFGVSISSGKAYVRGREVWLPSATPVEIMKARSTEVSRNQGVSVGYGRFVRLSAIDGVFNTSLKQQVILRNASDVQIGTARVHAITRTGTKFNMYLFDIKISAGKNPSTITKVTTATALGTVDGAFQIRSADSRQMFQDVSNYKVATLKVDGVDSLSYVTQKLLTAAPSGGVATFTVSGTETFYGVRNVDISQSNTWLAEYLPINTVSGDVVVATAVTISTDGKSIAVTVPGLTDNLSLIAPVHVTPEVKKKTRTTKTYSAVVITAVSRKFTFDVVDAFKVVVKDSNDVDVTSRFVFDDGQRDDMYDYGSITLSSGSSVPSGPLTVELEYFAHTGTGYFSVDSYIDTPYEEIPVYKAEDDQSVFDLASVIDFRYIKNGANFDDSLTPIPDGFTVVDYRYYLPRRDLITLSKNKTINIVNGIPSLNPLYPSPSDSEMILFKVDILPYVKDYKEDVFLIQEQNRRYTMKDIGKLDQRISRLEYETSLSLLESIAKTQDIVDENGLSRYKTGFLVDSFAGHGVGDTTSGDYRASIDKANRLLRPSFKSNGVGFDIANVNGFQRVGNEETGYFMILPFTQEAISQNLIASKGVSVTPYLVTKRVGSAKLNPSSDYWKDTKTAPVFNVDMTSEVDNGLDLGVVWDDWNTTWAGTTTTRPNSSTTRATTTTVQSRTGTQDTLEFVDTTQSIGKYVVDVNVSHFMRAINIKFFLSGMRPDTDHHVFIDGDKINPLVESAIAPVGQGSVRTNAAGNASGTIKIPAGRFRTGERLFTFSDEPNNVSKNATSEASFTFASSGLNVTDRETVISTSIPQVISNPVTETRTSTTVTDTVRPVDPGVTRRPNRRESDGTGNRSDPYAQSIWVSPEVYPNGAFISELTIYMKRKPTDTAHPLLVQFRPSVNAYPSSNEIIPYSEIAIQNSDVKIPRNTDNLSSVLAAPTVVKLPVPLYVPSGQYFNFVLLSTHSDYEVYASEMGENIIGTDLRIYKQPVLGSAFRSQNSDTWTAYQNEDIMHQVKVCKFKTSAAGSFEFQNKIEDEFKYNIFNFKPQVIKFDDHVVEYALRSRDSTTSAIVEEPIVQEVNHNPKTERILRKNSKDVIVTVKAATKDQYTSPFFELNKCYGVLVGNIVNNLGLPRRNFTIVSGGANYTSGTTITITGGNGSGAVYKPVIQNGIIIDIKEVNQGSGYTAAPTVTVNDTTGTGAQIVFAGFEEDPINGNAECRYVTKVVTLKDGYFAERADVYLDISSPSGTEVKVFYRCKNSSDEEAISSKNWKEIVKNNRKTSVSDEYIETKFEVELGYTADNGSVFENSDSVQVKVVLLASNTSIVPKIKNFRMITSI